MQLINWDLKKKHNVPVIVTSAVHDVNKKVDLQTPDG